MQKLHSNAIRSAFLLLLLVFQIVEVSAQTTDKDLLKLVRILSSTKKSQFEAAFIDAVTTGHEIPDNYVKFRNSGDAASFLALSQDNSPLVRLYALLALVDTKYPKLYEVLGNTLGTEDRFKFMRRDAVTGSPVSVEFSLSAEIYERVNFAKPFTNYSQQDSIFYLIQQNRMDSVVICYASSHYASTKPKPYARLLFRCLGNTKAYPGAYSCIKQLSIANTYYWYLEALAKYRKQEDVPIILSGDDKSLRAISSFPTPAFWSIIEKYKGSKFYETSYWEAVSSYKNLQAAQLMDSALEAESSKKYEGAANISKAISLFYSPVYDSLITKLWKQEHAIEMETIDSLIARCPQNASFIFTEGLLNYSSHSYIKSLDSNYSVAQIIHKMLLTIAQYNSTELRAACHQGIANAGPRELDEFLSFAQYAKLSDTKELILSRLEFETSTWLIDSLIEAAFKYHDTLLNKQIVAILVTKQKIWDEGNWGKSIRALLKQNKIILPSTQN